MRATRAVRGADWGDLHSMIVSLPAGTDLAPVLQGLPNDRRPCPHRGYVIKGRIRVRYADREEVLGSGDLFDLPPPRWGPGAGGSVPRRRSDPGPIIGPAASRRIRTITGLAALPF